MKKAILNFSNALKRTLIVRQTNGLLTIFMKGSRKKYMDTFCRTTTLAMIIFCHIRKMVMWSILRLWDNDMRILQGNICLLCAKFWSCHNDKKKTFDCLRCFYPDYFFTDLLMQIPVGWILSKSQLYKYAHSQRNQRQLDRKSVV